jgi:hypothetical protein
VVREVDRLHVDTGRVGDGLHRRAGISRLCEALRGR